MSNNDFCKLFNSEKYGQILAIADTDEQGYPSVQFKFQPKDLGVCGICSSFKDDDEDEAWYKVDLYFNSLDLPKAEELVGKIIDNLLQ